MISNEYEIGFEDGRWVSKAEAAMVHGVSERTIENRIKTAVLQSRLMDGKTQVFLRNSKLGGANAEAVSQVSNGGEILSRPAAKIVEAESVKLSQAFEQMIKLSDRVLDLSEENKRLNKDIDAKSSQLTILNNERVNYNTALQKAKDTESDMVYLRGRLAATEKENAELKAKIEMVTKKPWWKIW